MVICDHKSEKCPSCCPHSVPHYKSRCFLDGLTCTEIMTECADFPGEFGCICIETEEKE